VCCDERMQAARQVQIRAAHSTADRRGGLRTRRAAGAPGRPRHRAGEERGQAANPPGAYGKKFAPDRKSSAHKPVLPDPETRWKSMWGSRAVVLVLPLSR
jgi:hypothetical protein